MNNKLLFAGLWTMSMVGACHGAEVESKIVHLPLAKMRRAIHTSVASPMSKLTKLMQLEEQIKNANPQSIKDIRAVKLLQSQVEKDQRHILSKPKIRKRELFPN